MSSKNKKFKEALMAAALGACVTFLMHVLEYLTGLQGTSGAAEAGGAGALLTYVHRNITHLV